MKKLLLIIILCSSTSYSQKVSIAKDLSKNTIAVFKTKLIKNYNQYSTNGFVLTEKMTDEIYDTLGNVYKFKHEGFKCYAAFKNRNILLRKVLEDYYHSYLVTYMLCDLNGNIIKNLEQENMVRHFPSKSIGDVINTRTQDFLTFQNVIGSQKYSGYGLMDSDGIIITEPITASINLVNDEKILWYIKNNETIVYDIITKTKTQLNFYIDPINHKNNSNYINIIDSKKGIYDLKNMKQLVGFKYDYLRCSDFSAGVFQAGIGDKYGIINLKGDIIIPIEYDSNVSYGSAEPLNEFVHCNKNGKIELYNPFTKKKANIPKLYENTEYFMGRDWRNSVDLFYDNDKNQFIIYDKKIDKVIIDEKRGLKSVLAGSVSVTNCIQIIFQDNTKNFFSLTSKKYLAPEIQEIFNIARPRNGNLNFEDSDYSVFITTNGQVGFLNDETGQVLVQPDVRPNTIYTYYENDFIVCYSTGAANKNKKVLYVFDKDGNPYSVIDYRANFLKEFGTNRFLKR